MLHGSDPRLLLDTQELAVARDRERELKQDISRLHVDLELIPNFQSLNYVKFFRIAICKIS